MAQGIIIQEKKKIRKYHKKYKNKNTKKNVTRL